MKHPSLIQLASLWVFLTGSFASAETKLPPYPGPATNRNANPAIASGSHSGFYIRMAEDIATLCSEGRETHFRLNVVSTEGGLDSVRRLRDESEVQLAIVQSDLWYFAKQSSDLRYPLGAVQNAENRKAWAAMTDDIRIILPLYEEKIHIVVRPKSKEHLKGKDKYLNLLGLLRDRARVNLGTSGSGNYITCTLIEQLMLRGMKTESTWEPRTYPTDEALNRLVKGDDVDAVILVGGVPYPALDKFGLNQVRKLLGIQKEPELALLPIEDEANEAFDADSANFPGYIKTSFDLKDLKAYEFLTAEKAPIPTRGVMACLVTHERFANSAKNGGSEAKLAWVQHVLSRTLAGLSDSSWDDLRRHGSVGELWAEVRRNIEKTQSKTLSWAAFGWSRHGDGLLQKLVDEWSPGKDTGLATSSSLIDPRD